MRASDPRTQDSNHRYKGGGWRAGQSFAKDGNNYLLLHFLIMQLCSLLLPVTGILQGKTSIGVRMILPLTIMRVLACLLLLPAQSVKDKVAFVAVVLILIGIPSGVEVFLALYNYASHLHQDRRMNSTSSEVMSIGSHNTSSTTLTSNPVHEPNEEQDLEVGAKV